MPDSGQVKKVFGSVPVALSSGGSRLVDARGMARLTFITGAGCTLTCSSPSRSRFVCAVGCLCSSWRL